MPFSPTPHPHEPTFPPLLIQLVFSRTVVQSVSQLLTLSFACAFLYPEFGCDTFLRNVSSYTTHIAEEDGLERSVKSKVLVIIFPEMSRNELTAENELKAIMRILATAARLTLCR
jgi:hypothetical protein